MKTSPKQFLPLFIAMGFIALAVTGRQTTKGVGRDLENLGEAIQNP
jgi:predicted small secreted protein